MGHAIFFSPYTVVVPKVRQGKAIYPTYYNLPELTILCHYIGTQRTSAMCDRLPLHLGRQNVQTCQRAPLQTCSALCIDFAPHRSASWSLA